MTKLEEAKARYNNRNKNKDDEKTSKTKISRLESAKQRYKGKELKNIINFDTFEADLNAMGKTLQTIGSEWQTPETMNNTRAAVEAMHNRINAYNEYQKMFGGADLTDLTNTYQRFLDNWDDQAALYGKFQNAEAYNAENKNLELSDKYRGMTFDEVQAELKKWTPDTDEYKFLSTYTGYTDLEEFDKAVAAAKNTVDKNMDWYKAAEKVYNEWEIPKAGAMNHKKSKETGVVSYYTQSDIDAAVKARDDYMRKILGGKTWDEINAGTESPHWIDKLEIERNKWALDNAFDMYDHLMEAEDFEENSVYKPTKGANDSVWQDTRDKTYEFINNPGGTTRSELMDEYYKTQSMVSGLGQSSGNMMYNTVPVPYVEQGLAYLTDEEIKVYNYLYEKDKKSANKFLDDMKVTLNKRATDETTAEVSEWVKTGGFVGNAALSLATIPMNLVGSIYGIGADNPYSIYRGASNMAADIRTATSQKIAENTEGWDLLGQNIPSFLYNTGMSMGDSTLGVMTFGQAYSVVAGSSVFQQKQRELIEAGENESVAFMGAFVSGLAEMAFEYFSIDKLVKIKDIDSFRRGCIAALKQGGIEASEEIGTELANMLSDTILRGDSSELMKQYDEWKRQGYSESEIAGKMALKVIGQAGWAGVGGFLSGIGMGGGRAGVDLMKTSSTGKGIKSRDRVEDTINTAKLTPTESEAYQAYTEYAKKGINAENITDAQLGNLYNKTARYAEAYGDSGVQAGIDRINTENAEVKRARELTTEGVVEPANIRGIKVGEKTTVVTPDGEIAPEKMSLNKQDAELVAYAERIGREYGEDIANNFITQYDGKTNVEDYANSFNLVTEYAKHNYDQGTILENKGVLSNEQVKSIYESTVKATAEAQQKAIDEVTEKQSKTVFVKGKVDDSVIDYDSKTTDGSKVNWNSLTSTQRKAIRFVQLFSKATGVNINLTKSEVVNGKHKGENGSYDPKTNTITIDVYAGRIDAKHLNDSIIPTLSHEMTHWMKAKVPSIYNSIREDILNTLAKDTSITRDERIDAEMRRMKKAHPDQDVTPEDAIDEIVARACEDMLSNSNAARKLLAKMSATEQQSFIDKVKETFENLMQWINDLLKLYKSESKEAEFLRQYKYELKKISKQWDAMLTSAIEANQALQSEGIIAEELINGISKDGTTIVGKNNIQMSERTYEKGGREFLENWLSEQSGLTEEDAADILRQTDMIKSLMEDIRKNNDLPDYANWASMDVIKDENGEKVLSVIVKNGDYAMNIDFSQVCKKRVALNAVLNALVQSGDLNAYTLTETDIADLNAIIKEHEFEIACALCFVDSKRYRVGSWAESFCEGSDKGKGKNKKHQYGFNEMVRSLIPEDSNIQVDEFNFTNREIVGQPTSNLLSEMDDSQLDFTLIDQILATEDSKTALYNYAKAIKEHPSLRKILNPAEIISSIGLDAIRLENKELYRLINRHQGTAKPKFSHDVVAYGNDILKANNFTAEKAKYVGGVRCQSFSDFMANMVFDYVQFIAELSAKELTAHSYTKEPLFVKLFGMTGMKINMSLVPKAVQMTPEQQEYFAILNDPNANKRTKAYQQVKRDYEALTENAGLDENGNYIWEDETFPYDVAMELVVDPRYSANCGTIAVGISDNHILKLLDDERISQVIPYHKSGLNHIVAMMRNINLYKDYTNTQNTRFANGSKLDGVPDFDFYGDLYGKDGKEGTHDPKKTADNYLKWCDEHNYIPKFEKSRIGRKFRNNPNYYKLLIDFRVYDTDGTYREQQPVKPIYPAKEEFNDLLLNGVVDKDGKTYGGLKQQQTTSDKLNAESKQIVEEFRNKLKDKYGKDVLATKNSDRTDSEGNTLSEGQQTFFKDSKLRDSLGRLLRLFHGTRKGGFTKFSTKYSDDGITLFLTANREIAETYSGSNEKIQLPEGKKGLARLFEKGTDKGNGQSGIYEVYANVKKLFVLECDGGAWDSLPFTEKGKSTAAIDLKFDVQGKTLTLHTEINGKKNDKTFDLSAYDEQILERQKRAEEEHWAEIPYGSELVSVMRKDLNNYFSSITDNEKIVKRFFSLANGVMSVENEKGSRHWLVDNKTGQVNTPNTRYVSKWAKNNGYDGVMFKNVIDTAIVTEEPVVGDVVVVFDSSQIKSVDNLNPTKNKDIRYSDRDSYAPTFYSQMGETIGEMKQDKIGATSVVPYLKGRGVKDEEIKWSGIETFLEGKKSVTKAELQEFVAGSMLQIEENTRQTNNEVYEELNDLWEDAFYKPLVNDFDLESGLFDGEKLKVELAYMEEQGFDLPSQDIQDRMVELADSFGTPTKWDSYKLDGGSNYRELTFKMPNSTYTNAAMQSHWGKNAEGILAHARIQDFLVNAKKMLFIEEIQSDWHNAGHKVGYQGETASIEAELKEIEKEISKARDTLKMLDKEHDAFLERYWAENLPTKEYNEEVERYMDERQEVLDWEGELEVKKRQYETNINNAAPDAPFKDSYHEFVLKRLLRMAAEQGYDSIGWTPADIQSKRWSEAYAEGYRIEYDQDIPKFLNKYGKKWGAKVGSTKIASPVTESDIESRALDILSEKGIMQFHWNWSHEYGLAYEQAKTELSQQDKSVEVWSMDLTDSMKESVLYKGQVQYADRENPNIDKNRAVRDNVSRANKQGELVNEFYTALSRDEWYAFYQGIKKGGFLGKCEIGTVAPIVVKDKLVIAERLYMGQGKHDYQATAVFKLYHENYYNFALSDMSDLIKGAYEHYDNNRIQRTLVSIIQEYDGSAILYRFDRDSGQFVEDFRQGEQSESGSGIQQNSGKTIVGKGLSFGDKQKIQGNAGSIKQSDRIEESVYDKMGETKRLESENAKLKADIERLKERLSIEKKVTHGNYFNRNQLDAVAGHIRKIAGSTYSKTELVKLLDEVYSYIATSENLNWDDLYAQCCDVARSVLEESKPVTETNDYAKQILDEIRSAKFWVNEGQKNEAKYAFGNKWHQVFFGKTNITNDLSRMSLDQVWKGWAETYPDIFDATISDAEMLVELNNIYARMKDASEVVVDYYEEDRIRWLAKEIYNQYWNVSTVKTTADKYDKQIKRLNFEHRKAMAEFRNDYEERLAEQKKTERERTNRLVERIRERKDKEIAEAKQLGKERLDKYKENAERKTKIQSITSNALTLNKWLIKNSKDEHIHESLKGPVIALLQAIDFSSQRMLDKNTPTRKDISLQQALSKVKDMMADASVGKEELVSLYGHDMDEDIKTLVESVDNIMRTVGDNEFVLNQMSLEDLQTLDKLVKTIKHSVTAMNRFHAVNHARGIANLSQESMQYLDSLGKGKVYDKLPGAVKKLIEWGNALPHYVFKRYGKGGQKVFEAFQDGWDKFAFHVKQVIDYANSVYTSKEVKEWGKDIRTFTIKEPAKEEEMASSDYKPTNQKVQMSVPQIMSLYCLWKRKQAREHILGGGIRIADIKQKSTIISQSEGLILTYEDVTNIIDSLSDRQREVADKLQEFMNTVCSDWGNEVSMLRFGYKAFGEENYFPIQSDKNNLATEDETEKSNSLFRLLNMSFTKALTEKANNRIVISDIFDVFAQHSSDMAKYNALALPVLDAFKWYNYKEKVMKGDTVFKTNSVKQSIETAFGKDGQNYFTTFLRDLNGDKEVSRDNLGGHFFTNAKIAAVGLNLRVVFLQPTSYIRASAVIDNKYLSAALLHKPKIAKAKEHCGMALWKSLGYYDTDVQRGVADQIKHSETFKDKASEVAMFGAQKADELTWGYLWNACELEIRRTRKELKVGSDEFNQAIAKRLREIIYSTQVVDSTMTRSQIMRGSGLYEKMLTAFGSEPTIAYNMLQDAYMGTVLDARQFGKKEAIKKNAKNVARVVTAYTLTNIAAAIVESGFDAFRDDDDEEEMDLEEFMRLFLTNFASDMSLTAKIPYIKEMHSIIKGFGTSRTDTQWMESIANTLKGWIKIFSGEGNPEKVLKNSLRTFSDVSGLPFFNVYRDLMAALDKLDILTSEDLEELFDDFF